MRQAGVIAAAGLYALEHNIPRLEVDHDNAARLGAGLRNLGLEVEQHTNMVFVKVERPPELVEHLKKSGVVALPGAKMRLVTHLDVDAAGIDRALEAFRGFFSPRRAAPRPSAAARR